MNSLDSALARVRDTFAVAAFPEGGVLLHLRSGDFFALDALGGSVWRCIVESSDANGAVDALSIELNLSDAEALVALNGVVRQGLALNDRPPTGIPRFDDDGRCLSLSQHDETVLAFDRSELRLTAGPGLLAREHVDRHVQEALRIFVPKMLGTWFPFALHASAIEHGGKAVLFSGASGAGKTTTAHLVTEELADARLLTQDVSLLATIEGEAFFVEGAEAVVHPWMDQAAATLVKGDDSPVDVESLRHALAGCSGRVPLHQIIFVDRARRGGSRWRLMPLSRPHALQRLFENSFPLSAVPTMLKSQLALLQRLTLQVTVKEAEAIPEGLSNLRAAIRDQRDTIAS